MFNNSLNEQLRNKSHVSHRRRHSPFLSGWATNRERQKERKRKDSRAKQLTNRCLSITQKVMFATIVQSKLHLTQQLTIESLKLIVKQLITNVKSKDRGNILLISIYCFYFIFRGFKTNGYKLKTTDTIFKNVFFF